MFGITAAKDYIFQLHCVHVLDYREPSQTKKLTDTHTHTGMKINFPGLSVPEFRYAVCGSCCVFKIHPVGLYEHSTLKP